MWSSDAEEPDRHDGRTAAERHKPHAADQSPQVVEIGSLAIDRRKADRCQVQSEVGHGSKDQHPRPHENVNAVLSAAHPARQNNLREVEQSGAEDADSKGQQCVALGALALAIGGKDVDRLLDEAGKETLRAASSGVSGPPVSASSSARAAAAG